jgi:hypothetical protein
MKAKKESKYAYPLKLDGHLKEPLKSLAASNRRKINDEINIAVEKHLFDVSKDFKRKQ